MKVCYRCHIEKSNESFTKDKCNKSGLGSYCKQCRQLRRREYRAANKELLKKASVVDYLKNRDRYIKRASERQRSKRLEVNAYRRRRYFELRKKTGFVEYQKEQNKKQWQNNPNCKKSVRRRNIENVVGLRAPYVKHRLKVDGFPSEFINEQLVAIKRLQLQTKRELKKY